MIRRLSVRNFRSLRETVVELGPCNVFVGPNMSGKSNVLSVLRFLAFLVSPQPGVSGLSRAVNTFGGGFSELAWRGDDSELISMELEGDLAGIADGGPEARWAYRIDIHGSRLPGAPLTIQDEQLRLSGPQGDVLLIERDARTGHRLLRNHEGQVVSEVSDSQRSSLEFEIPNWDGVKLRALFSLSRFYRFVPQAMKRLSPTSAARFLDEEGGNLAAWLLTLSTRHRDNFDRIERAAISVLPDLTRIYPFPTSQAQVFVASSERFLRSDVPAWQMSDGELCFIALLSLIFTPSELGAPVYCVEEPENHLHPRMLELLVEALRQQQQAAGPHTSQVLITTHSPQLVDRIGVDDLVIVGKDQGATACRRPSNKQQLQELLEEAGLGELYFSGALGGS